FIYHATGKNHKSINKRSLIPSIEGVEFVQSNPSVGRPPVTFMDTPGLDASADSDARTLSEIALQLQQLSLIKAVVIEIKYPLPGSFAELCGQQAMSNLVVVTTMWSEVPEKIGGKREKQLKEEFCREILGECQMARFTNEPQSSWSIVDRLLGESPAPPLTIQTELEDKKLPIHETRASIQQKNSKQVIPGGLLSRLRKLFKKK
ncbi:12317_t:CDS:2, partial [Acaulospora colombiana]